ncbi:MAG: hypothetical protein ACRYFS_19230 [Janthinobacterium lividum]
MKRNLYRPLVGFLIVCVLLIGLWFRQLGWQADFSKWSPAGVFQMVLGQPPPPGVTSLQVSGRHYVIKRWVCMHFQATPSAMKSLASLGTPISSAETKNFLNENWTANQRYDAGDREKVNWVKVEAIARPHGSEFYMTKNSPWTWHGVIVFDYPNHTVYIQAHGD